MNLLGKKHDGQFIRWKPFATSTPLKPISVNTKNQNGNCPVRSTVFVPTGTQNMSDNLKNIQNKASLNSEIKISKKNRSRAYFDLGSSSSSDDDDPPVENRPTIKINAENTEWVKVVTENGKCSVGMKLTKNRSSISRKVDNPKCQISKCETQEGQECKVENRSVTCNSDLENIVLSHDNEISLTATLNNLCSENGFYQRSKQEVKQVNKVTAKQPVLELVDKNHKHVKNVQMLLKQKEVQNRNAVSGKKRRAVQAVLTNNPKMTTEIWANSSHQLFTDSIQEELINSLCLTTPEMDKCTANVDFSKVSQKSIFKLKKNRVVEPASSKEYEIIKEITNAVKIQERPKRTKQAPKNYWLVDDRPKFLKIKSKCTRISKKKPAMQYKYVKPTHKQIPDQAWNTVSGKSININQIVPKNWQIPANQNDIINNCQNQEFKKCESLFETNRPSCLQTKKDKGSLLGTKHENSSKHPVFIPLNEISYNENELGHQVSQICSLKNFTCGIFKTKPGSNFTLKKSQGRDYMGGILIKGEMKITTGSKEHVLHEGDMVLLPPSSEYEASNNSKCDLSFYYWTFNK